MVEVVQRAIRKDHIPLPFNVVKDTPGSIGNILHIYIIIHNYEQLCEHHLPLAPEAMYYFLRMSGIAFPDRNQCSVMKNSLHRKVYISYLRKIELQKRQKDAFRCLAHITVFHRGLTHYCGRVHQVLSVSNTVHMKYRIVIRSRIETGVVPERSFHAYFSRLKMSLYHQFAVGRHLDIGSNALDHLYRLPAQKAGKKHLIHRFWQRCGRCIDNCRVAADCNCGRHLLLSIPISLIVAGPVFVNMPVHAGSRFIVYMYTVHTAIQTACNSVSGEYHGKSNESPLVGGLSVTRPALDYRKYAQVRMVLFNHLLAWRASNGLRKIFRELQELRQHC